MRDSPIAFINTVEKNGALHCVKKTGVEIEGLKDKRRTMKESDIIKPGGKYERK